MICSHARKFIFIKTSKTAGTSLEMVLERICGPRDMVTPIWGDGRARPADELERAGRNHLKPLSEFGPRDLASLALRRRRPQKFANHEGARTARAKLPREVWDGCFKFAVVRNPFDRIVSLYFWLNRDVPEDRRPDLFSWMRAQPQIVGTTWDLISDGERSLLDDHVRYENMAEDLARVGERIGHPGLAEEMAGSSMKATQRPRGAGYREVMDDRSRRLVELLCAPELEMFGYDF